MAKHSCTTEALSASRKKPIRACRIAFILFCCVIPVIHWLIFYIYGNASSFLMAFTDKNGAISTENFVRLWKELSSPVSDLRIALKNTLITFAIILISFPFQVLVSYFIYKKVPGSGVFRILFFLPGIIFSVALSMIFTRILGINGFIAEGVQQLLGLERPPELLADSRFANVVVLLHMIWINFPGDLIIWGGTFSRIPVEVLESGRIDGVNWWQELTKIIVPLVWPTVALKMVLSFCGIFSASGEVFLLTGGHFETITLSCWMYRELLYSSGNAYHSGIYNYMSAVGMVMTVLAITLSLVIRRWTDKVFDEVEY